MESKHEWDLVLLIYMLLLIDVLYCVMYSSLVKRLEFGPALPRGVSQGAQSPQGGVKILL